MKHYITILCLGFCLSISITANAEIIFKDSFESADMSATSTDGFQWGRNNLTSVVREDCVVYNNRVLDPPNCPHLNWTPKTGSHSLRFRYHAGKEWTEQRYDAGGAYPELWVSYWFRIPTNYYRESPSGQNNNKWFDILMGPMSEYQNSNVSRIEMQTRPGGSGKADINIQFRNGTDGRYRDSNSYEGFLDPADAGRWMHIVYHLKSSSSATSTDGIIRMYRKWDGSSSYELINELVDLNVGITTAGRPGWSAGYIMGYANAPYAQETDWLLDDFTLSTTNLIDDVAPPLPPTVN